jgi:hypothetical protein
MTQLQNASAAPTTMRQVWDPFAGTLPFQRQHVAEAEEGRDLPGWLNTALGLLSVAGALAILVTFVWAPAAWFGVPALAVSVGGLILGNILSRSSEKRARMFFLLAEKNDWAFRLIEGPVQYESGGRKFRAVDPFSARAYEKIQELCRPRPGQLIPLQLEAMFWGNTRQDIPFWLGLQQFDVDASLAVEAIKKDNFGGRAVRGKLFNMAVAYNLDRDTGIRAHLLAEAFNRDGWHDLKTESVEFNRRFNIAIADDRSGDGGELALLRALTPATQAVLIDLRDRYHAQLIIDGPTIYLAGHDRIMTEENDVIAARFDALVEQFAEAAVSFKHFAE